ncbi:MAG: helix-turn-helix domain-containing protein [Actinomycetota bacterium]|nr:helix-turn-helix domain-containing protein [Actinomycetota bacterium]
MRRALATTAERRLGPESDARALTLEDLPDLLTVAEAAAYLRVGRNTAYALCRQWRLSGGREGLGCLSVGRGIRVPKAAVQRFVAACQGSPARPEVGGLGSASAFVVSTGPANASRPHTGR